MTHQPPRRKSKRRSGLAVWWTDLLTESPIFISSIPPFALEQDQFSISRISKSHCNVFLLRNYKPYLNGRRHLNLPGATRSNNSELPPGLPLECLSRKAWFRESPILYGGYNSRINFMCHKALPHFLSKRLL